MFYLVSLSKYSSTRLLLLVSLNHSHRSLYSNCYLYKVFFFVLNIIALRFVYPACTIDRYTRDISLNIINRASVSISAPVSVTISFLLPTLRRVSSRSLSPSALSSLSRSLIHTCVLTSAVRYSKMAALYTAAVAPTRPWLVVLFFKCLWILPTGNCNNKPQLVALPRNKRREKIVYVYGKFFTERRDGQTVTSRITMCDV